MRIIVQSGFSSLWNFAGHRPAIGGGLLVLLVSLQSAVAYGRHMLY